VALMGRPPSLGVAIGFATQLGFQVGRIGFSPEAIAAYYRGGESGGVMTFPKTFGQLLEVSHAHAFTMAVIFLILAICSPRRRRRPQ
jgi:hypothetical protein